MSKLVSVVLIAIGIILVILGINATQSFSSDFSRFFTGAPTDKAIWMLLVGVVLIIVGAAGSIRLIGRRR